MNRSVVEVKSAAELLLVPAGQLAPGQIGAIRNELKRRVLTIASSETRLAEDRLVVRDIDPQEDLSATYLDWYGQSGGTSDSWEVLFSGTLADSRWCVFYGCQGDNIVPYSFLRFNTGGADRVLWNLQNLNPEDGYVGVSPGGICIPQSDPFTISGYVRHIQGPNHLILLGFTVEKVGARVSP